MADTSYYIPLLFGASTTLSRLPPLELNMTTCLSSEQQSVLRNKVPNPETDSPRFPSASLLVLHLLPFEWGNSVESLRVRTEPPERGEQAPEFPLLENYPAATSQRATTLDWRTRSKVFTLHPGIPAF